MKSGKTYIGLILHAYQPPTQIESVLWKIFAESYCPVITLAERNENVIFSMDIAMSLGERLPGEFLARIRNLYRSGRIEIVNTPAYHYLLPLFPDWIVKRQIELNHQFCRKFLTCGDSLSGVFLPELAFSPNLPALVGELGHKWLIADDGPFTYRRKSVPPALQVPQNWILEYGDGLNICQTFLRSRYWSDGPNGMEKNLCDGPGFLDRLLKGQRDWRQATGNNSDSYVILALDFETFGHHNRGTVDNFLRPFFDGIKKRQDECEISPLNKLRDIFPGINTLGPEKEFCGSWATSMSDLDNNTPFPLWNNRGNEFHVLWNKFMNIIYSEIKNPDMITPELEYLLDRSFYSCTPWQYSYGNKGVASWAFPLFKNLISAMRKSGYHTGLIELEKLLKKMEQLTGIQE